MQDTSPRFQNQENEEKKVVGIVGSAEVQPTRTKQAVGVSTKLDILTASSFSDCFVREKLAVAVPEVTDCFIGTAGSQSLPLLDTLETSVHDEQLSAKTERKRQSVSLAGRIGRFDSRRAEVMRSCGQKFSRLVSKCIHKHELAGTGAFYCKDRLCPTCQRKRSNRLIRQLAGPLKAIQDSRQLYSSFVTLTLANTETLPSFSDLSSWKRKLLRDKFWQQFGLFGAVCTLEVKLGEKSGQWHCHFHIVALTEKPVPTIQTGEQIGNWQLSVNQELSEAWLKVNEGAGFIVRGKAFDGNYAEVIKYISKEQNDMSDEQLEEFCKWSKGRRFLSLTGKLYNNRELKEAIRQSEEENKEEATSCQCPECGCSDFERHDFKYDYRLKSYVLEKVSDVCFDLLL